MKQAAAAAAASTPTIVTTEKNHEMMKFSTIFAFKQYTLMVLGCNTST